MRVYNYTVHVFIPMM